IGCTTEDRNDAIADGHIILTPDGFEIHFARTVVCYCTITECNEYDFTVRTGDVGYFPCYGDARIEYQRYSCPRAYPNVIHFRIRKIFQTTAFSHQAAY